MKMLTLDKVFNAQTVLKNSIRETNVYNQNGELVLTDVTAAIVKRKMP